MQIKSYPQETQTKSTWWQRIFLWHLWRYCSGFEQVGELQEETWDILMSTLQQRHFITKSKHLKGCSSHECDKCEFKTTTKDKLASHMKTHDREQWEFVAIKPEIMLMFIDKRSIFPVSKLTDLLKCFIVTGALTRPPGREMLRNMKTNIVQLGKEPSL